MNRALRSQANTGSLRPAGALVRSDYDVLLARAPGTFDAARTVPSDPLDFLVKLARQQGDVARHDESATGPVFLINRPDLVGQVLRSASYPRAKVLESVIGQSVVATEGAHWRRRRQLMSPHFQKERITAWAPMITRTAVATVDRWQRFQDSQAPFDLLYELQRLAISVLGHAMFSTDLDDQRDAVIAGVLALVEHVGRISCILFGAPFDFSPTYIARFRSGMQTLDRIAYRLIDDRRRMPQRPADFLSTLIEARDPDSGAAWSDRDLRDEVVAMLFAGHENTTLMLAWTLYLLAQHPLAEGRLHEEIDRVLTGRIATVEDLPQLPYTRMVLQEALRLYPPVWEISRKALHDDTLGGHPIPAGAAVVVSPYTMHRHPDYWTEPEQFAPERFEPAASAARPRHAFFPFGAGPHVCLGEGFAMLEGQLILATVAQRFRVRPVPDHPVKPMPLLTLRFRHGLLATLEARSPAGTPCPPGKMP